MTRSADQATECPRLSFIILQWGNPNLTLECLESIEQSAKRLNCEIILVDNGSRPDDYAQVAQEIVARRITVDHLIRLPENVGFSRGMNAGIERAQGDLVVALNSDTLIGAEMPSLLMRQRIEAGVGFYAVPVFDAEHQGSSMRRTRRAQAEVTALTCYVSCLPVGRERISKGYILGPPGPAVIMTRALVQRMNEKYGFVYDPSFFLYGDDVDLFLRARREGFRTEALCADFDRHEVIWHVGSPGSKVRTLDREPEFAAYVLAGCFRNLVRHAGLVEFIPLLFLQMCFRITFCVLYWRRHSWRQTRLLVFAGIPVGVKRSRRKWTEPLFLLGLIALIYRRPGFWAQPASKRFAIPPEEALGSGRTARMN